MSPSVCIPLPLCPSTPAAVCVPFVRGVLSSPYSCPPDLTYARTCALSFPPILPPSLPPTFPPSLPPLFLPPFVLPSHPPSLCPSLPHSLVSSLPFSLPFSLLPYLPSSFLSSFISPCLPSFYLSSRPPFSSLSLPSSCLPFLSPSQLLVSHLHPPFLHHSFLLTLSRTFALAQTTRMHCLFLTHSLVLLLSRSLERTVCRASGHTRAPSTARLDRLCTRTAASQLLYRPATAVAAPQVAIEVAGTQERVD